jgi:hypothetical protein
MNLFAISNSSDCSLELMSPKNMTGTFIQPLIFTEKKAKIQYQLNNEEWLSVFPELICGREELAFKALNVNADTFNGNGLSPFTTFVFNMKEIADSEKTPYFPEISAFVLVFELEYQPVPPHEQLSYLSVCQNME